MITLRLLCHKCQFLKAPVRQWEPVRNYTNRNVLNLAERGLYSNLFPDAPEKILKMLSQRTHTVYAGFDPTADSLHIGNLLIIMNLIHWQRAGHQPIALMGGATARVGDPSGRSSERPELLEIEVNHNTGHIMQSVETIFQNHEEFIWKDRKDPDVLKPVKFVNNLEWYDHMSALDFIGKIGRHFRMVTLLGKESVKERMNSGHGLSYTEFSYTILQAFDWLHLLQRHNCHFQIGGNDQLGNIASGVDLIHKTVNAQVYGFLSPLIVNEEGDKLGKSSGTPVWLSRHKTSPFQFYQFFVRTKDSEVENLLKKFTFEPLPNIEHIMLKQKAEPEKRIAQKFLAEYLTKLIHGEMGLLEAKLTTSVLYDKDLEKLKLLEDRDLVTVFGGAALKKIMFEPGTTVKEMAMMAECFPTDEDAMRIITSGGFSINYAKVTNIDEVVSKPTHILPNDISLLRVGKKNYTIVKWLN